MKLFLIFNLLRFFKKRKDVVYKSIMFKEKFLNVYCYECINTFDECYILTNKKIVDFSTVRMVKYSKFKNYYII